MPNGIGRAVSAWQVLCTVHGQWPKKNDWQFSNPRLDTASGEDTCNENRQRTCQARSVEADDYIIKFLKVSE